MKYRVAHYRDKPDGIVLLSDCTLYVIAHSLFVL